MQIEGSSTLVVGGASGLGEATVRELHGRGAIVTIADVNADKGSALASELGLEFVTCDVREEGQVQDAVEKAAAVGGGLRVAQISETIRVVDQVGTAESPREYRSQCGWHGGRRL